MKCKTRAIHWRTVGIGIYPVALAELPDMYAAKAFC